MMMMMIPLFISNPYIRDPKRDKFHSNDPVFEFTILGFLAKTEKNLHSKIGAKVNLALVILQIAAVRTN